MWIVSTTTAQVVPQADASDERPVFPLNSSIPNGGYTVPMTTTHLEAVTLFFHTESGGVGQKAVVEFRAAQEQPWGLVEEVSIPLEGSYFKRYPCPIGQLRVQNILASNITVWALGYSSKS